MLGLLFVVLIIMVLAGRNYRSATGTGGSSAGSTGAESLFLAPLEMQAGEIQAGRTRIDHSRDLVCESSRNQLSVDLNMMAVNFGGEFPAPSVIKQRLGHFRCTSPKGQLQYDEDGGVYCTEHAPAPGGIRVFDL
jgi:hypothetical protein